MVPEHHDAAALEQLAIETFARVRGGRDVLARRANLGVDFVVLPNAVKIGRRGLLFTVRLIVFENGAVRDIKEQAVPLIPEGADDDRIPAYLEGLAVGIRRTVERGADLDATMPHDFIPWRPFRDRARRSVEEFAACVGVPTPITPLDDLAGTTPIAANPDLEDAIADDPDAAAAYLVYGDWLALQGDPRGELTACTAPAAPPAARRRAGELFARHERYLLGQLEASARCIDGLQTHWELGWIKSAWVGADLELAAEVPGFVPRALRGLLGHPSSKFLRKLTLGCFDAQGLCDYGALYPILVEGGPRRTLRELFIGDTSLEHTEIGWTRAGDLAALRGLYPGLRRLKLRAGSMALRGGLAYPALEELVIESGGLPADVVRTVAAAPFPALRRLELWLGARAHGATATLDDVAPILAGAQLPRLDALALRNCESTDDLCRQLVMAPLAARITSLDLSMGVMTDDGVAVLLAHRARLGRLRHLDVSDNFLTAPALAALRALAPGLEVVDSGQKDLAAGAHYVSVGA